MALCSDVRGYDKLLHFLMGMLICLLIGVTFAVTFPPHIPWLTVTVALTAVAVIGLIKELLDSRFSGNHFCLWDLIYTIGGGVLISWLPWLVSYLLATGH